MQHEIAYFSKKSHNGMFILDLCYLQNANWYVIIETQNNRNVFKNEKKKEEERS